MKAKTEVISLRLTPEEKRRLEYSAEKNGKEPVIYPDHSIKCILQICPEESGRCNRRIDLLECTHNHCKHSHGAAAETKRQQPSRKETTMQYKDWDGNLLPNPAPTIEHVHIGDTIRVKTRKDNFEHTYSINEYEIIAIYPRIVLTKDKQTGFRKSFSYGDLLTMGMEYQGAEVEDMRATYGQDQKRENLTKKLSLFNPDYNPDNYKKGKKKSENNRKENPAKALSGGPGGKEKL